MKLSAWGLVLAILLTGCTTVVENPQKEALFQKFDAHCRDYARKMAGEADEKHRYDECMSYFIKQDFPCPYCVIGSDAKSKN